MSTLTAEVSRLASSISGLMAQLDVDRAERVAAAVATDSAQVPDPVKEDSDPPPPPAAPNPLLAAFRDAVGEWHETSGDVDALQMAFDTALSESETTQGAVERFGSWLNRFRLRVTDNPSLERTPRAFFRSVADRGLDD